MRISDKADFFEEVTWKLTAPGFRITAVDQSPSREGSLLIDKSQAAYLPSYTQKIVPVNRMQLGRLKT